MIQTPTKNWWLLVFGGIFEALLSAMSFSMQGPGGSMTLRTSVRYGGTLEHMGMLALAAGVCMIAAGVWSSRGADPGFWC